MLHNGIQCKGISTSLIYLLYRYVLKREKPKVVSKQKAAKGKKKKSPKAKTDKVPQRKQQKKKKTVKELTKNKPTRVDTSDDSVAPPSLAKQDTLPAVNEVDQQSSVTKVKKKASKASTLSKQASLTVGTGQVYIPPEKQWPVTMVSTICFNIFQRLLMNPFYTPVI